MYWGLQNLCTMQSKKLKPSSIDRLLCYGPQDCYKPLDMPNALHFLDFASWCKDSAIPSSRSVRKLNKEVELLSFPH